MNRSSGSPVRFPTTVIWVSPAMSYPCRLVELPVLVSVRTQQLQTQDGLVQTKLTFKLLRRRGLRGEVDDRVDAIALLLDGEGQTATAPYIEAVDCALVVGNHGEVLLKRRLDRTLVDLGVKDDHHFVLAHK